jgi:hypothetical protein
MPKYEGLANSLMKRRDQEIILTFAEIEKLIGAPLPDSKVRPQFWANVTDNDRRPVSKAIRAGGYSAFLLRAEEKVRFVRD